MSTIKDVAQYAGVSTATVSHVVNKNRFVSDETTRRVLDAMEKLQYRPNALARSLRRKNSFTLGLILPDSANPFYADLARGAEHFAYQEGYTVLFGSSEDDQEKEANYLRVFQEQQVDGIILLTAGKNTQSIKTIVQHKIPIVILDHNIEGLAVNYVVVDNFRGGFLAAEHLIQLGHRKLACIYGQTKQGTAYERLKGFLEALKMAEIPFDPGLMVSGDFTAAGGYRAAQILLGRRSGFPTAIFSCNDLMAFGVMSAFYDAGLHIPDDISIVGFDDISLCSYVNPQLTTIRQPIFEMGYLGAKVLLEQINAEKTIPGQLHILSTELIIRKSTKSCSDS